MRKKIAVVLTGVIIVTMILGFTFLHCNESVSADGVITEFNDEDDGNEIIDNIKSRYDLEETIFTVEELRKTLKELPSCEARYTEKVIAITSRETLVRFLMEETYQSLELITCMSNEMNNIDCENENIVATMYQNGDVVYENSKINEYGTLTKVRIEDKSINSTNMRKNWYEKAKITGEEELIDYGERTCRYEYSHNYLGIPALKQIVAFKLVYKASEDGLKALDILDDGTKSTLLASSLKIDKENSKPIDTVATHEGANIDGVVIARFRAGVGFDDGGVSFGVGFSYNYKINFWLTLTDWRENLKNMFVKKGGTVYFDLPGAY